MVSSVCRICRGIRESRMVCGRVPVACSRCCGILWHGRIRRAFSSENVWGAKLGLLPGQRFCGEAWAVAAGSKLCRCPLGCATDLSSQIQQRYEGWKATNGRSNQASPGAGSGAVTGVATRCGAVITRMTAVRMTAAATIVRTVIVSPAMSHPRNNATTGFTNA
jgi:hypothetical protein